jgi:SOS-response transcriptional repressor LexA
MKLGLVVTERTNDSGNSEATKIADRSHLASCAAEPLTLRQLQVLLCIEESVRTRGAPPTQRELCAMLGMTSRPMLRDHLEALERKGFLRIDEATVRGLAVLVPSSEAQIKPALKPLAKAKARSAERKVGT